jgi:hypothetical protein
MVKMTVPLVALGHLIGKGGANVRDILSKSGATVKVIQDAPPTSLNRLDRPVVISGSIRSIAKAQEMILEKLCSAPEAILNSVKQVTNPAPGYKVPQSALTNSTGGTMNPTSSLQTLLDQQQQAQSQEKSWASAPAAATQDPQSLLLSLQQQLQQPQQAYQHQLQSQTLQNLALLQNQATPVQQGSQNSSAVQMLQAQILQNLASLQQQTGDSQVRSSSQIKAEPQQLSFLQQSQQQLPSLSGSAQANYAGFNAQSQQGLLGKTPESEMDQSSLSQMFGAQQRMYSYGQQSSQQQQSTSQSQPQKQNYGQSQGYGQGQSYAQGTSYPQQSSSSSGIIRTVAYGGPNSYPSK